LQNAAFALIGSFSTPQRLAAASKAKRSGIVRVFYAFKALALTAGYPRKINEFALQAAFFKGLAWTIERSTFRVNAKMNLPIEYFLDM